MPGWLPAVLLLIGAGLIGPHLGGAIRPAFILGCGAAGWYAWRCGPGTHLQAALLLLSFGPFVRRLVDLSAGYDPSGIMLVGPMLAIMVPAASLLYRAESGDRARGDLAPLVIVGICITYATALTLFQGDWMNAASGTLKWTAPLLYAAVLIRTGSAGPHLARAASAAFLVILPLSGSYGILQYVNPPDWDRYWMSLTTIMAAGLPLPYEVRTFSTMNGPASFATFTAAGLLLVWFLRAGWYRLPLCIPAALSLLLSMSRTAWISLAAGVLFCLLFTATRKRAANALLGITGALAVAATLTPFGDVIADRFATLGDGAGDGSAQERLDQLVTIWTQPYSGLFGGGFTNGDVGSAGTMAVDGMLVLCWVTMGIVVGLICLAAFVWAAARPAVLARVSPSAESVVVGALAVGALAQLPLASIATGELGFLFWTFAVAYPVARHASSPHAAIAGRALRAPAPAVWRLGTNPAE